MWRGTTRKLLAPALPHAPIGIFCSGLNAYCMQTGPLFLRISGSSGVLKAFLLGIGNYPVTQKKKKKKASSKALLGLRHWK